TGRRSVSIPQAIHADAASLLRANGPATSVSFCHGRWPNTETRLRWRTCPHGFPGAATPLGVGQSEDGWYLAPALCARWASQSRGTLDGQGSSQLELHSF